MRLGGAFLHPGLAFLPCKWARVTPSCPHREGAGRYDAWDVVAPGIQIFFGSWNKAHRTGCWVCAWGLVHSALFPQISGGVSMEDGVQRI